ncbi:TetR/AcrR family transcriptional regulator [uncultured Cetobacterium sp.]|uniref:TetR/AcrR family transcriptional regulator n=1 Tax=uncultured Cetobacterium sp. TaxID=527638 RepID=UPI0026323D55|nr:TetR/AcrR family transcriptional regulator [uncultured Cetobacterium sp.]
MKTRDRILESAQQLFSQEGFEKISTKRLAVEARCNEVTIFRLFGTKNNILEEIINRFVEESKIIKILHECLTGELEQDISKSILLYQSFLQQHEVIFRLQLKLSDSDNQKFLRTIDFKNYLVDHFIQVFYVNKINHSPEVFVNDMLASVMGGFLLKILTKNRFSNEREEYFLNEKIKFYQKAIKQYQNH